MRLGVQLDRLPSGPQLCIDFWRIGIVVIFWTRKDAAP